VTSVEILSPSAGTPVPVIVFLLVLIEVAAIKKDLK
jgi:hypothetical protein